MKYIQLCIFKFDKSNFQANKIYYMKEFLLTTTHCTFLLIVFIYDISFCIKYCPWTLHDLVL